MYINKTRNVLAVLKYIKHTIKLQTCDKKWVSGWKLLENFPKLSVWQLATISKWPSITRKPNFHAQFFSSITQYIQYCSKILEHGAFYSSISIKTVFQLYRMIARVGVFKRIVDPNEVYKFGSSANVNFMLVSTIEGVENWMKNRRISAEMKI